MSQYNHLIVVLENDLDDARTDTLAQAIKQFNTVVDVKKGEGDVMEIVARARLRHQFIDKLNEIMKEVW